MNKTGHIFRDNISGIILIRDKDIKPLENSKRYLLKTYQNETKCNYDNILNNVDSNYNIKSLGAALN